MLDVKAGDMSLRKKEDRIFSTATLKMGEGTTGKLVSSVKKRMIQNSNAPFAIIDGSPGIGCPVISSMSGVDVVLIVAEPSLSGIGDMKRIIKTARTFDVKVVVCVNKFDTNIDKTNDIISYCKDEDIDFVGSIPYDEEAVHLVNRGLSIVHSPCKAGEGVINIYNNIKKLLF